MSGTPKWRRLLRVAFTRKHRSEMVDDELKFHIDSLVERLLSQGSSEEEARRTVERRFDSLPNTRASLVRRKERRARYAVARQFIDSLIRDVRIAARIGRKQLWFSATAIFTIALGIGANTAIFCVANGVLIQPLPVSDPSTLVRPNAISPLGDEVSVSIPNFVDWRGRNRSLEYLGLNANRRQTLTGGTHPEVIGVRWILGDFFEALGVQPILGRWIESHETSVGSDPIAVLSHSLWQRSFGGDPDVLGQTISLDGVSFDVVGIMPQSFVFPSAATGVFVPMGFFSDEMCWDDRYCSMGSWAIGRLREGMTAAEAQADLDRVTRQIADLEGRAVATIQLEYLQRSIVGDIEAQIWVLVGTVGLVLLIACANVASLLLAKGEERAREIGVCVALGAGRFRIARQCLVENLLLAAVGGVGGLGMAYVGIQLLMPYIAGNVPSSVLNNIRLDPVVLLYVFSITVFSGLLFGLVPAMRASRADVAGLIGDGARGTASNTRQQIRSGLIVTEVALTLILLIGAGLMMQSLRQLQNTDKGFSEERVFTANIFLPSSRYENKEQSWRFYSDFLERVQTLAGVNAASLANTVPLGGANWTWDIWPEGTATEAENARPVLFHMATPNHFGVMGIPLVHGRLFDDRDRYGMLRVAIVDEAMAAEFWPGEDPIGKRITFETVDDTESGERIYRTVVGVVGTVSQNELSSRSGIQVYVPMDQSLHAWSRAMVLAVKTVGEPLGITPQIRRELATLDPDIPLARIETMEGYVRNALSGTLVIGGLLSTFSISALVLAAVGLYGVIAYAVTQRYREIGIRIALGGDAGNIIGLITAHSLKLTAFGIGLGICGAVALSRLLRNMLYGVNPVDPVTYAVVSCFMAIVIVAAGYIPARRATVIDPAMVLRQE